MTLLQKTIKTPCHASWNDMKIGCISRHCEQCNKAVIDFTRMDRTDIIQHLLNNRNDRVCGRIRKSDLAHSSQELLIVVRKMARSPKNQNMLFFALVVSSLLLSGCTDELPHLQKPATEQVETINFSEEITPSDDIPIDEILMGDIVFVDEVDLTDDPNYIFSFPETMPEYNGGYDGLFKYIEEHLIYPESELKKHITGKVFAELVIEKDGNISNIHIVKTVEQAKNFDSEVIRVLETMPKWKPGMQKGIAVRSRMIFPITFKL